jgi:redox-sensitive bicupin YhaK (pirin superfamily)
MIHPHRTTERRHILLRRRESWHTFGGDGFGALIDLREDRIPPRTRATPRRPCDAEVVTYVLAGSLTQQGAAGRDGNVLAGEFQRTVFVGDERHGDGNPSRSGWAHVFTVSLHAPAADQDASPEQRRYSAAQRRGLWCVVASPDGHAGSLRLAQDVRIHSTLLGPGQHLVHALAAGRGAWLHVLHGEVALADLVLTTGDGAGFTAERVVSLTARADAELLLIDLPLWKDDHD